MVLFLVVSCKSASKTLGNFGALEKMSLGDHFEFKFDKIILFYMEKRRHSKKVL